MDAMMQETTN